MKRQFKNKVKKMIKVWHVYPYKVWWMVKRLSRIDAPLRYDGIENY